MNAARVWAAVAFASSVLVGVFSVLGDFEDAPRVLQVLFVLSVLIVSVGALVVPRQETRIQHLRAERDAARQIDASSRDLRRLLRSLYRLVARSAPDAVSPLDWSVVALLVLPDGESLDRVASFTLRSGSMTPIEFRRGKGVVGWALSTNTHVTLNLDQADLKLAARHEDSTLWEELPDELRMGLSFEEFRTVTDYTTVFASPVYASEGTEAVGVVSVTGPGGSFRHLESLADDLATVAASATTPFEAIRDARKLAAQES